MRGVSNKEYRIVEKLRNLLIRAEEGILFMGQDNVDATRWYGHINLVRKELDALSALYLKREEML